MSTRARKLVLAQAVLAGGAFLAVTTGCQSDVAGLRLSPTPELATLTETEEEAVNEFFVISDLNVRMLNADLSRSLYLNRATRLNPAPIPR